MSDDIRAVRRTANDTYENLQKLYAWLKTLRRVTWTTAEGKKLTGYVELELSAPTTDNHKWFGVTDISEGGSFQIRVNDGVLAAADTAGIDSDPPTIGSLRKEYPVSGGDFAVENGSKVYLKITTTSTSAVYDEYTSEGGDHNAAESGLGAGSDLDELLTVETTVKSKSWTATAGEVIVQTATPTNTDSLSYALLAEIEIDAGTMIIKQRHEAAVTAPSVTGAYGGDPVITGVTDEHELCNAGVAETHRFISLLID